MLDNLEKELKRWRESRGRKPLGDGPSDRRTVRVNGQEVLVVRKAKKPTRTGPSDVPSEE